MATKDQIDVKKFRKEATKKVRFIFKKLNKNLPHITEGSTAEEESQQQPTGSYERKAEASGRNALLTVNGSFDWDTYNYQTVSDPRLHILQAGRKA